jgi:hypothetical protein
MGIDGYVSRSQLPGAAVTRRLARQAEPRESGSAAIEPPAELAAAVTAIREAPAAAATEPVPLQPVADGSTQSAQADPDRFSLVAIVAGGLVWLEELQGLPLATDQVQLVAAMAAAISPGHQGPAPGVTQFNWPMHNNDQLDQGPDAARAALQGFVSRKLDQHGCRGVILLGTAAADRFPRRALDGLDSCQLPATLAMLQEPALKKSAWAALQGMVRDH